MSPMTRPLGRVSAAALGAAILTAASLTLAAPANAAENDVVADSGSLDWGYKASFRNYVSAGGAISAADGAERSGAAANAGFLFPVAGGHVEDADTLVIDTRGKAGFSYPAHFFDVQLSNLSIVVDGGSAQIVADTYLWAGIDFGETPQGTHEATDVVLADVANAEVVREGDTVTVTGTGVTVTAEGAAANPLYAAGTALDDFTVTADVEGADEPTTPAEPADGDDVVVTVPEAPSEPSGSFSWEWKGGSPADLGTASQSGDSFVASGALNTIVVTDTRTGGDEDYGWSLSGSVSDFTSGAGSFDASHLGWTPSVTASSAAVTPGGASADLSASRLLAESTDAASAEVGATLDLQIPADTAAGDYRATVTITAIS
ncbi:HtaA domain-containing protein [Microbacterium rhizophilus]|uniref:HtaA domain-containing protein n=1 Tax=Microbacterium rhizophilus TaxID=3138934 RepID=UPI0031EAC61C